MHKTYFNWSSGKDSAMALYYMQQDPGYTISRLITTVNSDYNRVSMHGTREELLDLQTQSLNLPIHKIQLSGKVTMKSYDNTMYDEVSNLKKEGYSHCVFGDIFLEDLKKYREEQLQKVGIQPIFPLWKRDTKDLFLEFISLGFKAITVCTNAKYLDDSFCGRELDHSFLSDLPNNVDPCGENGEFHTFVYDGPIFNQPIKFEIGEKVLRTYTPSGNDQDDCYKEEDNQNWDNSFWYCDLLPKD